MYSSVLVALLALFAALPQHASAAAAAPNIKATSVTTTAVVLSWSAVSGAGNYRIEYAFDNTMTNGRVQSVVRGTTLTVKNLPPGTAVYFRGYTYSASGSSSWSALKVATTLMSEPVTPTLTVTSTTLNSATLTWTGYSGATDYIASASTDPNFPASAIVNGSSKSLSVTLPFLVHGKTYYFKVAPMVGSTAGSTSATVSATLPSGITLPSQVAPWVNGAANTVGGAELTFGTASNATSYRVSELDGSKGYILAQRDVTRASFSSNNYAPNKTLTFVVQACSAAGCGAYSTPVSVVTK